MQDYQNINDVKSIKENDKDFIEHRHDQSCFSVVRKHKGTTILDIDETYYLNFNEHMDKPIHAIRRRF
jgi:hypothetical protein